MVKPIVQYPDPALRTVSKEIGIISDSIRELAQDLIDTLNHSDTGVGLAANQIGVTKRIIAVRVAGNVSRNHLLAKPVVMINPAIRMGAGEENDTEGCLSCPGVVVNVKRHRYLHLNYTDLDGNVKLKVFNNMDARIIQHEIDHLNGICLPDKENYAD